MDSFEINKFAGAILGALFLVLGVGYIAEAIFHVEHPEVPGYLVEVADAGSEGAAEEEPEINAVDLIATSDPADGQSSFRACAACHSVDQGGENKVGPALWGVMGRAMAGVDGFGYSGALTEFGADKVWGYAEMDAWLANPKGYVPGTSMAYAGMRKPEDRAAMIAYLRSLAEEPIDLPEPPAAEEPVAEEDAAAVEEEAPAEAAPTDEAAVEDEAAAEEAPLEEAAAEEAPAAEETEVAAVEAEPAAAPEAEAAETTAASSGFVQLVAAGSIEEGEKLGRRCRACHVFEEGGRNGVGPALYDVIGRDMASVEGFNYSPAFAEFAAGKTWTYDVLSAWLENPKELVPGNRMAFPGFKDEGDRADMVAYLRSLSGNPAPLE